MIILEGPDGSGKTNLSRLLSEQLGLPLHERASDSRKGPLEGRDLWDWTCRDVNTWSQQELSIYDRHPLISEYIYGPHARGELRPGFTHPSAGAMRRKMEQQCLLVLALPPIQTVRKNVLNEEFPQMDGVVRNIDTIWWAYAGLKSNYNGWMVKYDYAKTDDEKGSRAEVLRAAKLHMVTWMRGQMNRV